MVLYSLVISTPVHIFLNVLQRETSDLQTTGTLLNIFTLELGQVQKCRLSSPKLIHVVLMMKYFLFSVQIVGSHFQFLRWTVSVTTLFVFSVVCRIVNRKWYPSWTLSKLMQTNLLWYNNCDIITFIFFNMLHVCKSLSLINYWTVRWNIWMFFNLHSKTVI